MANVKAQLRLLYAVELIGKGTYMVYAKQVEKRFPDFARKLDEYGNHEYRHAGMARDALQKHFNAGVSPEGLWIGVGKFLAYLQVLVLMGIKLWTLALIEKLALGKLKKDMASGGKNPYTEILEQLPPDEEKHALVYEDWKKLPR